MEYAEENLSTILSSRPLIPTETHEMLDPMLDALAYLHTQGFVHGHIKPSNIMAVNERLKSPGTASRRRDK
jgi:serine/threonine protein kinase